MPDRLLPLVLAALLALAACGAPAPHPTPTPPPPPSPSASPASCAFAPPVYHPDRLHQLGACATYRGIVLAALAETDGDHHLWIAPDPGYASFLDAANVYHGSKALVAEIVPACTSPPADATAAERCPPSTLPEPAARAHVEVVGPWVLDTVHGWRELHPLVAVRLLPTVIGSTLTFPTPGPSDQPDE